MSIFFNKLNWREKILFSLLAAGAVVEDILVETLHPLNIKAAYYDYSPETVAYIKGKSKTLQNVLAQLVAKKMVEIREGGGQRSWRLTAAGLDFLFSKFPKLKYGGRKWDGYWRAVVYDIQETERKLRRRLRAELRHLGFHFVQKSVWFSPFSVEQELEDFLRNEELWGRILVFKAVLPVRESQRLARLFWPQVSLNESRKKTVSQIFAGNLGTSPAELVVNRLLSDPLLPVDFPAA